MTRPKRRMVAAARNAVSVVLRGRDAMFQRPPQASGPPVSPISDQQAMAQVVEAARQIVRAARLIDVTGGFLFESCNDQGRPPYRGRVDMSFAMPDGLEPDAHFKQIAATMADRGWIAGPPPGTRPVGVVIHTETVMAIIGLACGAMTRGSVQVCGQCGNMTDHRNDGMTIGADITDELSGG